MSNMLFLVMKPTGRFLSPALMEQLAIRLSPQAGKSLVISRKRERGQGPVCELYDK
jgi:hypothetical protein